MEQTLLVLMKAELLPLLVPPVQTAQLVVPMQTAHMKTPRSKARSIHLPPLLQSAVPLPQLLVLLPQLPVPLEKELLAPLEVRHQGVAVPPLETLLVAVEAAPHLPWPLAGPYR